MDKQARAKHAEQLLADPLLMEAFDLIAAEAGQVWLSTGFADTQKREWAWLMAKAVARVRGQLEAVVTDGKVAAAAAVTPLR